MEARSGNSDNGPISPAGYRSIGQTLEVTGVTGTSSPSPASCTMPIRRRFAASFGATYIAPVRGHRA